MAVVRVRKRRARRAHAAEPHIDTAPRPGVDTPTLGRQAEGALWRWWWRATLALLPQDGLHHSWRGWSFRK